MFETQLVLFNNILFVIYFTYFCMLTIEIWLKQESDQDESEHNRVFFLKSYMLLSRVF